MQGAILQVHALPQGSSFPASVRPGRATHSPVYHHCVLHVLEQFLGLKQQGDIQNHVAVSWGEARKPTNSILQAHTGLCAQCGNRVKATVPYHQELPGRGGDLPRRGIT